MKKFLLLLLFFGLLTLGAAAVELSTMQIVGKTDKSPLSYKAGEKMIYTFTLDTDGQSAEDIFWSWKRIGDDHMTFSGRASAEKPLVIITGLDKPGFVNVNVILTDANGNVLTYKDDRGRIRKVAYYAGTAVEPETLSDCGEPADFDAFWAKQKARLAAVPFKDSTRLEKVRSTDKGDIYAVTIPCAGGRPVTGYLTIPANAKEKSLPARIHFFGYGTAIQAVPPSVMPDVIFMIINAHGQELGKEKAYYDEFFKSIRSNGHSYAFDPEQNKNPETAFFNGMALRALRAVEYLKSRPEWNGKELIAYGGSQGGLQVMWVTALDSDVTVSRPSITWCCDLAGTEKAGRISGPWRLQYLPALDYYDPVFMAKRIKKADIEIQRAGLGDYTCPPSGLAICYKNIASPKKAICWVQGSDHSFVPENSDVIICTPKTPGK